MQVLLAQVLLLVNFRRGSENSEPVSTRPEFSQQSIQPGLVSFCGLCSIAEELLLTFGPPNCQAWLRLRESDPKSTPTSDTLFLPALSLNVVVLQSNTLMPSSSQNVWPGALFPFQSAYSCSAISTLTSHGLCCASATSRLLAAAVSLS